MSHFDAELVADIHIFVNETTPNKSIRHKFGLEK